MIPARATTDRVPYAVLDAIPDIVLVLGPDASVRYVNAAADRVLGIESADVARLTAVELIHPDDLAVVASSMETVRGKSIGTPIEVRVRDARTGWRWMEVVGADHLGEPGVDGIVCVARDITSRRMWEVAGGDVTKFQQVLHHAAAITLLLDPTGVVTSVNGSFTRMLGHDPSVVVGRPLATFATDDGAASLCRAFAELDRGGHRVAVEVPMRSTSDHGPDPVIRFELVDLRDDPVVAGIVVSGHDVSELQHARRELEFLAHHDPLTGVANRVVMLETLRRLLDGDRAVAVVFADLDRFKPVNDLYGHETGDELLRQVASRLVATVRPGDLVARVGGDEFVVVAPGISGRADADRLADRIEAAVAEPFVLDVGPVRVGVSIGVSVSTSTSRPTVTDLVGDADLQMYDVKADRRGEGQRGVPDRRRSSDQRRRLADDLAAGLTRGEVVADLQPILALTTNRLVAVEALARWHHPELGVLTPAGFLELAEDAGLDVGVGDAVARSAWSGLRRLRDEVPGCGHVQLCLNASVGQLADPTLTERLATMVGHGGSMADLVIEITERATVARSAGRGSVAPESTLFELHERGAQLSLDDFGTGHSSLTHLRRYPLASIKIDRSFVAGMLESPEDLAVVGSVIGLASALGLRVIAEGIESAEQRQRLVDLGCHEGQGFALGVPMSAEALVAWARSHLAVDNVESWPGQSG